MSKKTLYIEIKGKSATGKTTFAQWLAHNLEQKGFTVTMNDPDAETLNRVKDVHEKLWSLKDAGLHVKIQTTQLPRTWEEPK